MLVSTRSAKTPTVERLIEHWTDFYKTDLSPLLSTHDPLVYGALVDAASRQGRLLTATRLNENLVDSKCQFAITQARSLYEYLPQVLTLAEAEQLTQVALQVYTKLLDLYQEPPFAVSLSIDQLLVMAGRSPVLRWGIQEIEALANALGPVLLKYQTRYLASKNWRTLGFLTTQLNFSGKLLLQRLTPAEQLFLRPYFKFVEEQVATPWSRVCAAAAAHDLHSPVFALVDRMMPLAPTIAIAVYRQLAQQFPEHESQRGRLSNPDIAHSCLRDLGMFQAYLWLSVLQGNLELVEQELVTLCVMVMDSIGVKWEMTAQWCQLLMDEVLRRVKPEQQAILRPYTEGIKQAFYVQRLHFGAPR